MCWTFLVLVEIFSSSIPVCLFNFLDDSLTVWYCENVTTFSDSRHFNCFGIFFVQFMHFCSIHFSLWNPFSEGSHSQYVIKKSDMEQSSSSLSAFAWEQNLSNNSLAFRHSLHIQVVVLYLLQPQQRRVCIAEL